MCNAKLWCYAAITIGAFKDCPPFKRPSCDNGPSVVNLVYPAESEDVPFTHSLEGKRWFLIQRASRKIRVASNTCVCSSFCHLEQKYFARRWCESRAQLNSELDGELNCELNCEPNCELSTPVSNHLRCQLNLLAR